MQIYPYQQECLDAIEAARQAGKKKALVVMATGLGKTVVSALQLKRMLAEKPGRVLYLAHQNPILAQAHASYERFLDPSFSYGYFNGEEKTLGEVDVLFASFQVMHTSRNLFDQDEFLYVVVDEAHHVQADTFRPTVEYFQPDFMIGLTATPDRADEKDIREIMGDPVYHLDLFEALAAEYLTSVNYRLMTDELQNLDILDTPAGKLSISELNRTIFVPKRDEEIVRIVEDKIRSVSNPRTIIFCTTIEHAEQIARLIPHSSVLHSKLEKKKRRRRIDAFRKGRLRTVVTVSMFNEGIDIPEANVVVFLRSTDSMTVYLQQLGRGLRRFSGKSEVLVLDFVANCERILKISLLIKGVKKAVGQGCGEGGLVGGVQIPKDILTISVDGGDFDERVVNLIDIVGRAARNYSKEELLKLLVDFAARIGRTPTIADVNGSVEMPSHRTYIRIFGCTWNDVLKLAGLKPVRDTYDVEHLDANLRRKCAELGRVPTRKEVNDDASMASITTYEDVYGMSLAAILYNLGLSDEYVERHVYTRDELIYQYQQKAHDLGKAPSRRVVDSDPGMASSDVYLSVLGVTHWSDVAREAGLLPNVKYLPPKEELGAHLWLMFSELGRAPRGNEVRSDKRTVSLAVYEEVFGKPLFRITEDLGMKPMKRKGYTKEDLAKQVFAFKEEHGRFPVSNELKARNGLASFMTFRNLYDGKKWPDILVDIRQSRSQES